MGAVRQHIWKSCREQLYARSSIQLLPQQQLDHTVKLFWLTKHFTFLDNWVLDTATGALVPGGVEAEAKRALDNMGHILQAAGISYNNVIKTTVLLADMNDFAKVNDIYRQYFSENYPARAAYQVAALPKGGRVEIEAVAVVGAIEDSKL